MSLIELKIPDVGTDTEVEVIEVLIQIGDVVELEQTLLVLETDKASIELPATAAGKIENIKVKVGDKVSEGVIVATLLSQTNTEPTPDIPAAVEPEEQIEIPAEPNPEVKPAVEIAPEIILEPSNSGSVVHASPGVRYFARELGVNIAQITLGSGRKGRIIKDDVKAFIKSELTKKSSETNSGTGIPAIPAVDFSKFGEIKSEPLNKIKRLTGKNLTCNWLNMPMVTQHEEADITEMEAFRKSYNAEQGANKELKITPLVFIIKALLAAMKDYPQFNSSLAADGNNLIYKQYFNIGIAVDTPNGLVVPVIKNADQKSLLELNNSMRVLSEKARKGKLMPTDMQGGCLTISSLGGIGGTAFTPIVNAPEVAILGVTRASMKPIWNGSEFIPKLMLPLDLTYDHRVIDGADGVRFVVAIAKYLADIRRLLL